METYKLIPLHQLEPHPHNPRGPVDASTVEELADSIREKGILQPLLVVPNPDGNGYRVVAGHRRRQAALLVGNTQAPCMIRTDLTEAQQEELMLIENIQRQDLSPLQEARAFGRLVEQGYTRADISRNTGLNHARVQLALQILKLSEAVQNLYVDFQMPVTAVPPLARITDPDRQARLANLVLNRSLPVKKLELIVDQMTAANDKAVAPAPPKQTRQRRDLPGKTDYGRNEAIADLQHLGNQSLTFADALTALNDVCHSCGSSAFPAICSACPLPQFLHNLTKGAIHADAQA